MAVSLKRKMRSQTDSFIEGYCVANMREEIMKMKRGFLKRSIGAALVLAMTTSLFTGCGNKKDGSNDIVGQVSQSSKDYVFAQEMIDIGNKDNSLSRIVYNGERVFTSSYMSDGGTEIYSFNSDGSDVRKMTLLSDENNNLNYFVADKDSNIYAIYYIYHWSDYGDDEMVTFDEASEEASSEAGEGASSETATETTTDTASDAASEAGSAADETEDAASKKVAEAPKDDECYLVKYDWDGNLIYKVDLMSEFGGEEKYVSANGMILTDNDELVISLNSGIYSFTEDGGFKPVIKVNENDNIYYQLFKGFGGKIFTSSYGDNGLELRMLDVANGKLSDPFTSFSGYPDYAFFGGDGYDLYCCKKDGILGFDSEKDTLTKLVDFVDSDIEITNPTGMAVAISDTEFITLIPDMDYNYYVARLTKIPPEQVVDKKIITMGGYYIEYELRKQAFAFNKENPEYKIKFVDYSEYDNEGDYGAGIDKMNMDIVSGNTPDIIILSYNMPVDSYINKGLFCDMSSYLNNDPDVSNVDLLTNVLDALRTGDKLYQITPSFYIGTMIAKTKFTDGKDVLSFKDCKDLMAKTGIKETALFGSLSRDTFLENGLAFSGNNYIDWENKTCNFNSESFIEFLEFAKELPETYEDTAWQDFKDSSYHEDESLFNIVNLNSIRGYSYFRYVLYGEDISFIGYPNDMGVNNSVILPNSRLTISAQSQNKDACWEFIKTVLTEEYQDKLNYAFPIRKSSFEKMADESTRRPYYMDGSKKVEYDDTYYIDGTEVKAPNLSSEEVVFMTNFIKSINMIGSNNTSVNNIIYEEASAFFSGQKSAKEVADIIQSRVSIYVNENS